MDEAGSLKLEKVCKKFHGKPCLSENTFLLWEIALMSRREGKKSLLLIRNDKIGWLIFFNDNIFSLYI